MYNTNLGNFNEYHLEKLTDVELINYAKLLIIDATQKEEEMDKHDTYNNSYKFASATQKVSQIIVHLKERGLTNSEFKFGVVNNEFYNSKNIKKLLNEID